MQAADAAARPPVADAVGVLRDGTPYRVRPLQRSERQTLVEGFDRLSAESRYRRFLAPVSTLSVRMLHKLVDHVDGVDHVALVLDVHPGSRREEPVAIARFIRDRAVAEQAEYAITVVDRWHGRGAGTVLSDALVGRALELGVRRFTADVHAQNRPSLRLLARAGDVISQESDGAGVLEMTVRLKPPPG